MARPCTICNHSKREEIDAALRAGEPRVVVRESFNLKNSALGNHAIHHVTESAIERVPVGADVAVMTAYPKTGRLLDEVDWVVSEIRLMMAKAKRGGKDGLFLRASQEVRQLIDLKGKLTGAFRRGDEGADKIVNVINVLGEIPNDRLELLLKAQERRAENARQMVIDREAKRVTATTGVLGTTLEGGSGSSESGRLLPVDGPEVLPGPAYSSDSEGAGESGE